MSKYKSVEHIIRELRGQPVARTGTTSLREALKEVADKKKKPDADGDGKPDWADKHPNKPGGDEDRKGDDKDDGAEKKEVPAKGDAPAPKKDGKVPPKKDDKGGIPVKTGANDKVPKAEEEDDDEDAEMALDQEPTKVIFNPNLNKDIKEGVLDAIARVGKAGYKAMGGGLGTGMTGSLAGYKAGKGDMKGAAQTAVEVGSYMVPGVGIARTATDPSDTNDDDKETQDRTNQLTQLGFKNAKHQSEYEAKHGKVNVDDNTGEISLPKNGPDPKKFKSEETMSDKKKSIQEALAEVQRNLNAKRLEETQARWESAVNEGAVSAVLKDVGAAIGIGGEAAGGAKAVATAKRLQAVKTAKEAEASAKAAPAPANTNTPGKAPANNNTPGAAPANNNTPSAGGAPKPVEKPSAPAEKPAPEPTPAKPAEKPSTAPKPVEKAGPSKAGATAALGATAAAAVAGAAARKSDDSKSLPVAAKDDKDDEAKASNTNKPAPVASGGKQTFSQAFAAARKDQGNSSGKFTWNKKEYQTNMKGKGTADKPEEKYLPASKLKDQGDRTMAPAPKEAPKEADAPAPDDADKAKKANTATQSESTLIGAFLRLQESKRTGNLFIDAKKMNEAAVAKKPAAPTSSDPDFAAPAADGADPKAKGVIKFKADPKAKTGAPVTTAEEVEDIEEGDRGDLRRKIKNNVNRIDSGLKKLGQKWPKGSHSPRNVSGDKETVRKAVQSMDDDKVQAGLKHYRKEEVEDLEEGNNKGGGKKPMSKLAADLHHHLTKALQGGEFDLSPKAQAAHRQKFHDVKAQIAKHHGKEAAEDAHKNASRAFDVEWSSGPADKGYHKKFADKHLGGEGSKHHEDYKSRLRKNFNTTGDSEEGLHYNVHESVEQIDEISSKTLLSYKGKAAKQYSGLHDKIVKANGRASDKDADTYQKREKGIAKADKKILAREDIEQIDEFGPTYSKPGQARGRVIKDAGAQRVAKIADKKGWSDRDTDKAIIGQGYGRKSLAKIKDSRGHKGGLPAKNEDIEFSDAELELIANIMDTED